MNNVNALLLGPTTPGMAVPLVLSPVPEQRSPASSAYGGRTQERRYCRLLGRRVRGWGHTC